VALLALLLLGGCGDFHSDRVARAVDEEARGWRCVTDGSYGDLYVHRVTSPDGSTRGWWWVWAADDDSLRADPIATRWVPNAEPGVPGPPPEAPR